MALVSGSAARMASPAEFASLRTCVTTPRREDASGTVFVTDLTSRYPGAHDLDLRLAVAKLCQGLA